MKKEGILLGVFVGVLVLFLFPVVGAQNVGDAGVIFSVSGWECQAGNNTAFWVKQGSTPVNASNNCALYKNETNGQACCPGSLSCDGTTCGEPQVSFCWQYVNEATCGNAVLGVGETSVIDDTGDSVICTQTPSNVCDGVDLVGCTCKWVTVSGQGQCTSSANVTTFCRSGEIIDRGVCAWEVAEIKNNCNTTLNNIVLSKIANWAPAGTGAPLILPGNLPVDDDFFAQPGFCANALRTYQCPSVVRLPFFTAFNFFLALAIISIVYFLAGRKDKK